jgi:hypothetical protein
VRAILRLAPLALVLAWIAGGSLTSGAGWVDRSSAEPIRERPAARAAGSLTPGGDEGAVEVGAVAVHVELAGLLGSLPASGEPRPPRPLGPAAEATVQVVDAAQPDRIAAEGAADSQGEVRFELPPGCYWVAVPWSEQVPGQPGAPAVGGNLPDGRPVLAWAEVEVRPGETADLALTIVIALT